MEDDSSSETKNIVLWIRDNMGLSYFWKYMVDHEEDEGPYCQLVHRQEFRPLHSKLPLKTRFTGWVRPDRTGDLPPHLRVATEAFEYVTKHYEPGDKVVVLADCDVSADAVIDATERLVRCLLANHHPLQTEEMPAAESVNTSGGGIPVECVAVGVGGYSYRGLDVTALNNDVLLRFPPCVGHIICWKCEDKSFSSCFTVRKPTGHLISKEVCFCENDYPRWYDLQIHLTKGMIHYIPEYIPQWEEEAPVWTHKYTMEPRQPLQDSLGLGGLRLNDTVQAPPPGQENDRPLGIREHQIERYHWIDIDTGRQRTCLVWKSFYD